MVWSDWWFGNRAYHCIDLLVTAHALFKQHFEKQSLLLLFEEKISRSKAVGKDGTRVWKFEKILDQEISVALRKVHAGRYKFTNYKERLLSKGPNKPPRTLSIPTVRDRLVLRALCDVLSKCFPNASSQSPQILIKHVREQLAILDNDYCFLRLDIKDFYPSIDQEILLKRLRARVRKQEILQLISQAIQTPTDNSNEVETQGVPQGLSISNILSSIYLTHLDRRYTNTIYFRYVDDILVLCKWGDQMRIYKSICRELSKINLSAHSIEGNKGKSSIASFEQGVEYLGYHLTKDKISVRESSYQRMYENLSRVFTQFKYTLDRDRFLWRINLKITGCTYEGKQFGWMRFFSQSDDIGQLAALDHFIKKNSKAYGLSTTHTQIRTFVKAYHEIRFNSDNTQYIPNFDDMADSEKIDIICTLTKVARVTLEALDSIELDTKFQEVIYKETASLEKDLAEAFS